MSQGKAQAPVQANVWLEAEHLNTAQKKRRRNVRHGTALSPDRQRHAAHLRRFLQRLDGKARETAFCLGGIMQKHFVIRAIAGGVCLMALSGAACAQVQAYTNAPVDVYAGPAPDYPVVVEVPEGVPLTVMGCVEGYSWCDVAAPDLRGWVYGESLSYPYQGTNVPVMTYGVQIGLPIVVFSVDSYWGRYYHDRPWYHDAARWANHPPPVRGGPPPVRGEVGRPPGAPPAREPAYGHAPEAPPQQGGAPQPGFAHSPGQPPPHGGPPQQVQSQARPQPQPGPAPAHTMDAPQMHGGSPPPAQRGGGEAHGGESRGGNDRENHPDNH
jgi:uncharacterized protein YraI